MLNAVHLRTLVVVVRTGSFAEAARELGYTGSAVSQQMSSLERQARVTLFDRSSSSIRPTPVALLLAQRSTDSLIALDALEEDLRAMATGQLGALRIGSFPTASEWLIPAALRAFRRSHPRVGIQLDEAESDELASQIAEGLTDVALAYAYDLVPRPIPERVVSVPLVSEDLLLIVSSNDPVTHREPVSWADLTDRAWVTTRVGTAGEQCLQRLCAGEGFVPRVDVRSNDYDVIRQFVRAGLGIALVPALGHTPTEGVLVRHIDGLTAQRHVNVLHQASALNPAVEAFIGCVQRGAKNLSGENLHFPG